jgi:hypothetical protein
MQKWGDMMGVGKDLGLDVGLLLVDLFLAQLPYRISNDNESFYWLPFIVVQPFDWSGFPSGCSVMTCAGVFSLVPYISALTF